ncbi:polyamine aminopropyltransferase [Paramaledivibacter caminithermalis]|jgi:spermidine synthase|uniref:Polyamine aminopropyltransferase n=1 Tax=Paramaledivibacter caminithermalis (strain DSM 15212 / CIP 107654 / DViRD3) TaxID=1121301 RepID=A0A1M6S7K9_PARC5|nr:polyamine aminopropyltransferase [Paramaledivibacter caminithermalis]SHK40774.1 spermidine synthase [Paramaledivibacter caminithermalis DSM 15212]
MTNDNSNKDNLNPDHINATPLLFAVFIIAICGIIYELIVGAISSYLLGDSVKQYSITIGLFMSAMGVGSYATKYFSRNLFDVFVIIELLIGVFGGLSAILLFASYAFTDIYYFVMYITIIIIGVMVGLEIPIITRIIEEKENNLRITIANVLSFDYIGALLGSLAFPLILLPYLGQIRTAFLVGFLNIAVAILIIYKYKQFIKNIYLMKFLAISFALLIAIGFITGNHTANFIEDSFYRDRVIYRKQTKYQKLVVTKHLDDLRMFLNGNIQFSSIDEYRYHEALIHPAMSLAKKRENILILGGGDGLAAREILKYDEVKSIKLVDLDPDVVSFCSTNPLIKKLNNNSLQNKKVEIINTDAYKYLENTKKKFDVIIVDLPDPNNEALNKLYTNLFYRLIYHHLNHGGFVAIQSTSPYYANEAYWCIRKTVESEGFFTQGYHLNVPSFGDWGFTLASNENFSLKDMEVSVPTRYLNNEILKAIFYFAKDEKASQDKVEINSLTNPVLLRYYQKAWNSY